ncbi:MAG: 5' nucleotidase, NT5C type [Myxococcota bacterium]
MERPRSVFVDLDDVLAETTCRLLDLLEERTGRRLAFEEVGSFDLENAFGLEHHEWREFMVAAHQDPVLDSMEPREGAAESLRGWAAAGWRIEIITGRPPSTESLSRRWLERHALTHHHVECVDKYGRPDWRGGRRRATPLGKLVERTYAAAVEDSPSTAAYLAEHLEITVALLDRPWNRDLAGLSRAASRRIVRCRDWSEVRELLPPDPRDPVLG